jgi:tetratricopeptide (TPR) repeat protein
VEYAESYNNLGIAPQDTNNDEEAIECFNKVLAIIPNLAEAYFNLNNALKNWADTIPL